MKANEIEQGGYYEAKISGQIVTVRVDEIGTRLKSSYSPYRDASPSMRKVYYVTNLRTGRKLMFKSAQKFRQAVERPVE